jgi:hypothetical protein
MRHHPILPGGWGSTPNYPSAIQQTQTENSSELFVLLIEFLIFFKHQIHQFENPQRDKHADNQLKQRREFVEEGFEPVIKLLHYDLP